MSAKGNELLLRARQQFSNQRTVETLRRIEVPELQTTIHYWPVRDYKERIAIGEFIKFGADRTVADLEQIHRAQVLYRARDELGFRLFADEDAAALEHIAPDLLAQISLAMGLGDSLTSEDAEKN